MLTAVAGYYNGTNVVLDEPIDIPSGQKVIVTILDKEKPKKEKINLSKYVGNGAKLMTEDAQEYVNKLRANDRF